MRRFKHATMKSVWLAAALALTSTTVAGAAPKAAEKKAEKKDAAAEKKAEKKDAAAEKKDDKADDAAAKAAAEKKAAAASAADKERAPYDAAIRKWEEAKKAGPINASNCKGLASKFLDAASHKPYAADAHFSAGSIYDSCGMAKEADAEYRAALQANPNHARAINNIGEAFFKKGDRANAKQWFDKAVAADPTHASSAYNNLGLLLYLEAKEKGQPALYKEAIGKLRRGLAIDSDSMPSYALLALIYYTTAESDKSKLQLAELIVKQAKLTNDKYAPIYNTMGLINLKRKNVSNALRDFEEAVKYDPQFVEAHLNIGAIGLSARQYEKAQASFEQVLKLQPNNFDATMGLGVALRGQKKLEDAEKFYKKAGELDPKSCAPAFNLGILHQEFSYKADEQYTHYKTAQQYFNQFASCSKDKSRVTDAQRRVKDIDDTFKAIAEQKKIEEENKKIMEEAQKIEAQQKAAAEKAAAEKPPEKAPEKAPEKK